jgi:hypothetical protein
MFSRSQTESPIDQQQHQGIEHPERVQAREAHAVSGQDEFRTAGKHVRYRDGKDERKQGGDVLEHGLKKQTPNPEGFGVAGAHLSRRSECEGGTPNVQRRIQTTTSLLPTTYRRRV